ncbi:hypothetical protein [Paenibacillus chitinolyticus]|uniref:hypothetical protein n=1 Tax=Paenibacillus chitinolyticus TaxID=79263 RepID=UPI00366CD174
MKKIGISLLSLFTFLFFASSAFAVTGEGAARLITTTKHTAIQGTLTIPSAWNVSNDGSYIAFYLGLGVVCEGGISFKPSTGWNKFLNCGGGEGSASNKTAPLTVQPKAGDTISLKLVNNLNDTATLYVNGVAAYTNLPVVNAGALKAATTVKMVHSTLDNQDKNSYTNASFSNVLVQSQSGGSYTTFPTNISPDFPLGGKGDYVINSSNPLGTTLKAGK